MKKIGKNKFIIALKNLTLLTAFIHIFLLVIYAFMKLDFTYLNYFNILDIDLFFPNVIKGYFNNILAVIILLIVYFTFYFFAQKKASKRANK